MKQRLFLLCDRAEGVVDEVIGIYDDILELKEAYERGKDDIHKESRKDKEYSDPERCVLEFDRTSQKFQEVDLQKLWKYTEEISNEYCRVRVILDHADMYLFYKYNVRYTTEGLYFCGAKPDLCDPGSLRWNDLELDICFSEKNASEIIKDMQEWWGGWDTCPSSAQMAEKVKRWEETYGVTLTEIAHDSLTFRCRRKPDEKEAEQLLAECRDLPSNALDLADVQILKRRLVEDGIFSLWWD